jgi:arginine-tRNA-protein transferase
MIEESKEYYSFKGSILDLYLEKGYYRMHQDMFTAGWVNFKEEDFCRVFWLRTVLDSFPDIRNHAVFKKNKRFSVKIKDAECNEEIEELFQQYRNSIDFETSKNISSYLFDYEYESAFDSKMIEIRNNQQLIAVGYFDQGINSIAGIMNFFHPDYKKFSLGKFLMLQKIQYAIDHGMKYYYTGYIALDYDKFDYKLFPYKEYIEVYKDFDDYWESFPTNGKEELRFYSF